MSTSRIKYYDYLWNVVDSRDNALHAVEEILDDNGAILSKHALDLKKLPTVSSDDRAKKIMMENREKRRGK